MRLNRLFDAKALTNWKRYRKDGMHDASDIEKDAKGTIQENLILKGNNLIALHSLKRQFAGKVKLIYIDPPYNTGTKEFCYNNKFHHSTWLVFMKNRLEVAKQLLRFNGLIFVSIDDKEHAYLKVLMDEVFGRENFVGDLIRKTKTTSNIMKTNFNFQHENTLIYAKDMEHVYLSGGEKDFQNYSNPDNDINGEWVGADPSAARITKKDQYPIKNPYTGKVDYPPSGRSWQFPQYRYEEYVKSGRIKHKKIHKENERGFIYKRYKKDVIKREYELSSLLCTDTVYMNQAATKENIKIFADKTFDFAKPEIFLKVVIESCTQPGDIVLDYHLGSGTTAAVAHKMGRQYIGIEQMDYIEDIAVARLRKVIEGEQGGISKVVQWKGGGSFLYCELAPWNEQAKKRIAACESLEALETFFNEMYERYFLNYNVKIKEFKDNVLGEKQFRSLSLEEHKRIFCAMLDNNQMYVPVSEMADAKYDISETDQKMTKKFYGE